MKYYEFYNSEAVIYMLFVFPDTVGSGYQNTVTVIAEDGSIQVIECMESEEDVADYADELTSTQYTDSLDHYSANCEASRIGKTPASLPPPNR